MLLNWKLEQCSICQLVLKQLKLLWSHYIHFTPTHLLLYLSLWMWELTMLKLPSEQKKQVTYCACDHKSIADFSGL